eukprot:m.159262 g.159262  ORF g.159262 m.159262 type:complete len:334 (-) comp53010_c0_seq2:464-1465(-)
MSFTAFPVLCSILKSTKTISSDLGTMTLASAAVDDILAWSMLAIASSFAKHGDATKGGATFGIALVYVLIMMLAVKPVVRFVHDKVREKGPVIKSAAFNTFLFLVLLTSSFTSEVIGIHAFFGAFIAGLLVPKDGHLPELLAPKIDMLTREVLLPLFFANSGISTNIGSLNTVRYWGIALAVIIIATIGKVVPAVLSARLLLKQEWRYCFALGILMNTRGLVELIALNVALQLGILSPLLFTIMVLMAIVTTALTGPLYYLVWLRHLPKDSSGRPAMYIALQLDDSYLWPNLTPGQVGKEENILGEAALDKSHPEDDAAPWDGSPRDFDEEDH